MGRERIQFMEKSVDRILELFVSIKGSCKYYGILQTTRMKITDHSDTVLESYI